MAETADIDVKVIWHCRGCNDCVEAACMPDDEAVQCPKCGAEHVRGDWQ